VVKWSVAPGIGVLLILSAASYAAGPATWPQWRGPTRDGRVAGAAAWPDRLAGEAVQPLWRVPLGPSYSGPIASETLVFTTETKDAQREVVRALDRATGQQRWEAAWDGDWCVPIRSSSSCSTRGRSARNPRGRIWPSVARSCSFAS